MLNEIYDILAEIQAQDKNYLCTWELKEMKKQ